MTLLQERTYLVLLLTKIYPSYLSRHTLGETDSDMWWVVYVDHPCGQLSWHIKDEDFHLFSRLGYIRDYWDGHTTENKYERIKEWAGAL